MIIHEPSRTPGMEYFLNPPREVYTRFDTSHNIEPKVPDLHRYNVSPPPVRELAARSTRRAPESPGNPQGRPGMSRGAASPQGGDRRQTAARFNEYNTNNADGGPAAAKKDADPATAGHKGAYGGDDGDDLIVPAHTQVAAGKEGVRDTVHWSQLSGAIKAEQITLKVFMPDRRPLEVRVEATAMAGNVVAAALATHRKMGLLRRASGGSNMMPSSSDIKHDRPELYCLMMHDGDGLPDDMAVPGDRTMLELNETEVVVMPKTFRGDDDGDEEEDEDGEEGEDDDSDGSGGSVDSDFGTKAQMDSGGSKRNKTKKKKKAAPPMMKVAAPTKPKEEEEEDLDSDEELMLRQQAARRGAEGATGGAGATRENRTFSCTPLSKMGRVSDDGGDFEVYDGGGGGGGGDLGEGITRRNTTTARAEVVSVRLPDESECKVKLGEGWRPADLIAEMALKRRHRIAIHSREYELHIMWLDQDRLRWPSTIIDPSVDLLGLVARLQDPEFELKPKEFLDKPKIKMPGTRRTDNEALLMRKQQQQQQQQQHDSSSAADPRMLSASTSSSSSMLSGGAPSSTDGGGGGGGSKGGGEQLKSAETVYELMYVVQTAEMLEEWEIIKTNRWGRQQKRVIGIGKDTYDGEYKVYNKKRDDVHKSRFTDSVARDFRLLRSVAAVRQMLRENKPRFFAITYREAEAMASDSSLGSSTLPLGQSGRSEDNKELEQVYEVPLSASAPKSSSAKGRALEHANNALFARQGSRDFDDDASSFGGGGSGGGFGGVGGSGVGGGGGGAGAGRAAELAEQEKQAGEKCLRIVAKMLFLLDLQRQRSERATRRRGSSVSGVEDGAGGGGGGGLRSSMQNTAGALLGGVSRGKHALGGGGKGKLGFISEGHDGKG